MEEKFSVIHVGGSERVSFGVLFVRVPDYVGDLQKEP